MDSAALDRALCERLGIAPIDESPGHKYADHDGTSDCENGCGAWMGPFRSGAPTGVDPFGECPLAAPVYPPLSTTGEGMLRLMEALEKAGHSCTIYSGGVGYVSGRLRVEGSAPMALALATAAALGIEVQDA